jgi:hypothetical protein
MIITRSTLIASINVRAPAGPMGNQDQKTEAQLAGASLQATFSASQSNSPIHIAST